MTFEDVTAKVEKYRDRGRGKGSSLCPAHPDKDPSLSLLKGGDRTLLHCFAGCSPEAICSALGIEVSDLFVEPKTRKRRLSKPPAPRVVTRISSHETPKILREYAHKLLAIADGYDHSSSAVLERARNMNIDEWTPEDLDRALDIVARAKQKQQLVTAIDDLAGTLKTSAMDLERKYHASRPRKTR